MDEQPKERFAPVLGTEETPRDDFARVAQNNKGEPLTWGATPLALSADIKFQQDDVKEVLESLFHTENVPPYVSLQLAEYIEALNMARTARRESKNQDSFAYREKTDFDGVPFEALEVIERALRGYASPAELLLVQKLMGVPSIELASLTHPYGQRIELLKEMRPAINDAILLLGGSLVRDVPPEYEVKGSDNPHDPEHMEGIHMTRKTMFGYLEDGTEIVERSSFVLLIDQLPVEHASAIRAIPYQNNPNWARQIRRAHKLYELVPILLNDDQFDKAVPISTTVVAVNATLEDKLLSDEAKRARRGQVMGYYASNPQG